MEKAILLGIAAVAPLVIAPLIGTRVRLHKRTTAAILAFAAGTFIAALTFDLFGTAFEYGGAAAASVGMLLGAAGYILLNQLVFREVRQRGRRGGTLLLAGAAIDGVPENVALGTTLALGTASAPLLLAIMISNFPEALVGSEDLRQGKESGKRIFLTWLAVAAGLVWFVPLGAALGDMNPAALAAIQSFAAGAVLGLVVDNMLPQAYEDGGRWVAFATTLGFLVSFLLEQV